MLRAKGSSRPVLSRIVVVSITVHSTHCGIDVFLFFEPVLTLRACTLTEFRDELAKVILDAVLLASWWFGEVMLRLISFTDILFMGLTAPFPTAGSLLSRPPLDSPHEPGISRIY